MFKWHHETSLEVKAPIQKIWEFYNDLNNWKRWDDRFDHFLCEGALNEGSEIQAKIKDKNIFAKVLVTKLVEHQEICTAVKVPFFTQKSSILFKETSNKTSTIILKCTVVSLFAPFMKFFFLKNIEKGNDKLFKDFLELEKS
jgi:hypothetical protein